jgi:hypothetical protein
MTDLSFMYKCGKCNRNFGSPDHLRNHEIPCRGKRPAEEAALVPQHLSVNDLAGQFPQARSIEFRRGLPTCEL